MFTFTERRARRVREASLVGLAGALIMALQSAFMLMGGGVALAALSQAVSGDLAAAQRTAGIAAVFVGITLLFDLVGVGLLSYAFFGHSKAARAAATLGTPDPERRKVAFQGFLAFVCLAMWLAVTLAWRGTLAALVSFYPTPLGTDVTAVATDEIRRAASIMLGLWVAAAVLLFAGSFFGARFLRRARGSPPSLLDVFWPFETGLHAGTAVAITLLAFSLLARPRLELTTLDLTTLGLIQTLGVLDLVVVPALGVIAYVFLFRSFLGMFRETRAPAPPPPTTASAPSDPPSGEA